jgi:multidrug resistance efflux pump
MTTIAVVLAVVAAVGGGVGYYIKHRFFDAASKPIPVQLETVTTGDLIELVSAPGEIEPKKRVTISAKTTARIMRLPYDEGEAVTAGDPNADPPVPASVLVALDDRDLRSQLRSAQAGRAAQQAQVKVEGARILGSEARLRALRVSLKQAELEQARTRQLCATGDLSQADLDLAETKVEELRARIEGDEQALEAQRLGLVVLEHNLEVADARIEQAEEALSYTTILSPIDGVITQLNAEEGEMVVTGTMNNPGTTIMVVADLERMLVPAQVDETDVGRGRTEGPGPRSGLR